VVESNIMIDIKVGMIVKSCAKKNSKAKRRSNLRTDSSWRDDQGNGKKNQAGARK